MSEDKLMFDVGDGSGDVGEEIDEFFAEDSIAEEIIEETTSEEESEEAEAQVEAEEEPEEVPKVEATEDEEPVEEAEEEIPSKVETVAEEPEEEVVSNEEKLRQQNLQLMQLLNQVSGGQITLEQAQQMVQPDVQKDEGQTPPEPQAPPPAEPQEEVDWSKAWEGVDFSEVLDSEDAFKGFMTTVLQTIYQQQQQTAQNIPQYVQQYTRQQQAMQEVHIAFYEEYPELSGVKNYVGQVATGIAQQNPGMELTEILAKAAETARTTLGIEPGQTESQEVKPKPKTKKANLPGARGSRTPQPKKTELQSEIDDLLTSDF